MRIVVACFDDVRSGGAGATHARCIGTGLRNRGHDVTLLSKVESRSDEGIGLVEGIKTVFHIASVGRAWRIPMAVRGRFGSPGSS